MITTYCHTNSPEILTMLLMLLSATVLQAQPSAQPPANGARLEITPAEPVVIAQDTLRLKARVLGADGQPLSNAQVRFVGAGGVFEGRVMPDGLVMSGSTGTLPVTVVAQVPGQPTITQRVEVRMVPGPAARIALDGAPTRLVGGQRMALTPKVFSAAGDARADRVSWSSSNPAVAVVNADGLLEARAVGRATLTARVDQAVQTHTVQVVAARVGAFSITPSAKEARTGDVIRFAVNARDAAGKPITGVTPSWSFSPGQGAID
ncbi:MAG: Ig-like domain-containing protein, partial [Gemmatimonadaceae bacterium]|nr:Ig-like domain-containing protein [Gemmatimonadaceae bacterium]